MASFRELMMGDGDANVREKRIIETREGCVIPVSLGGRGQHERNWWHSVIFTIDIESALGEKEHGFGATWTVM